MERSGMYRQALLQLLLSIHFLKKDEFKLYELIERIAPEVIAEERKIYKGVCINIDYYCGLLYKMLKIPYALYTPLFAIGRVVGWSAHRMEELINTDKIIRPAYKYVGHHAGFVPYEERTPEEGCEEVLRDLEKGAATEAAGETGENTEKEAPEAAKERSEEKE